MVLNCVGNLFVSLKGSEGQVIVGWYCPSDGQIPRLVHISEPGPMHHVIRPFLDPSKGVIIQTFDPSTGEVSNHMLSDKTSHQPVSTVAIWSTNGLEPFHFDQVLHIFIPIQIQVY